jgi:hypothetical protein
MVAFWRRAAVVAYCSGALPSWRLFARASISSSKPTNVPAKFLTNLATLKIQATLPGFHLRSRYNPSSSIAAEAFLVADWRN